MGKRGLNIPGCIKLVVFIFTLLFISGCETTKGFSKGVASGIGSTVGNTAQGAAKDSHTAYNFIGALDDWIKENLW
jgi:predicted small secreted protein